MANRKCVVIVNAAAPSPPAKRGFKLYGYNTAIWRFTMLLFSNLSYFKLNNLCLKLTFCVHFWFILLQKIIFATHCFKGTLQNIPGFILPCHKRKNTKTNVVIFAVNHVWLIVIDVEVSASSQTYIYTFFYIFWRTVYLAHTKSIKIGSS